MNPDTREFLDTLACIARANLNYLIDQEEDEMDLDDQGAQVLMSAYMELYQLFVVGGHHPSAPSPLTFTAAEACCAMRRDLESRPREVWSDDEQGLFKLMLGYMFMFKHLFVVRG